MNEISFLYLNAKGEQRVRRVKPSRLEFLSNPSWGYQPGWHICGVDLDKGEFRSFALNRIIFPEPQEPCQVSFALELGGEF